MKYSIFVILGSIINICFSQSIEISEGNYIIQDRFDLLYEDIGDNNNGDYSRGWYYITAHIVLSIPVAEDNNNTKTYLELIEVSSKKPLFKFSSIALEFSDGTKTEYFKLHNKRYLPELQSNQYQFDCSNYFIQFRNYSVTRIYLKDFERTMSYTPTDKNLFRRQFEVIDGLIKNY